MALAERKRAAGQGVVEAPVAASTGERGRAEVVDIRALLERRLGTSRKRPRAKGRPEASRLDEASKDELYEHAQKLDIPGRSKMTKEELVAAIRAA